MHSCHHRPSSGTGGGVDASSRTSAGIGAGVRKPGTSGGACCAGDIGGSEGVGRERGRRRATAPAVEEDAGSRAAPAVEVDLRGWGGMREREGCGVRPHRRKEAARRGSRGWRS